MKVQTIFENGQSSIRLIPENNWEERLLGASFEDGCMHVKVRRKNHISYQDCDLVTIERLEK